MSIQSEKEGFLKDCETIMRFEKTIVEKIEEACVRGGHHAEEGYAAAEELKKAMYELKPDHIFYLKRQGGLSTMDNHLQKLKDAVSKQKKFYAEQLRQANELGDMGGKKIAEIMNFCAGPLTKIEESLRKLESTFNKIKSM